MLYHRKQNEFHAFWRSSNTICYQNIDKISEAGLQNMVSVLLISNVKTKQTFPAILLAPAVNIANNLVKLF